MASRASHSVMQLHHTLGSFELLARQAAAVTAASPASLRGAITSWASTSKAPFSPSSPSSRAFQAILSPSLRRSGLSAASPAVSSNSQTALCRKDDAAQLSRMLFRRDIPPAGQTKLTRRIARFYSRRPTILHRQFDSLRPSSTSTSISRPFFTSKFRGYSTNTNTDGSSSSNSTGDAEAPKSGLMGKLKELTRKYGWATVVVYFLFSAVDFGACFFLINLVGAEHVRKGQDYVLDALVYGTTKREDVLSQAHEHSGHGVLGFLKTWRQKHQLEDAENESNNRKSGSSSLWATAVLAYGIHKTLLLPVRLGLTAAATPAIVKYLQRFGLNIARTPIPDSVKKRGAQSIKSGRERFDKAREKHKDWL